jgi:hypothetical protein
MVVDVNEERVVAGHIPNERDARLVALLPLLEEAFLEGSWVLEMHAENEPWNWPQAHLVKCVEKMLNTIRDFDATELGPLEDPS